jgi:hypothetical protein
MIQHLRPRSALLAAVLAAAVPAAAVLAAALLTAAPAAAREGATPPSTPPELTATYGSIADVLLAAKKAESGVVRSILGTTYAHARGEVEKAKRALKAGDAQGARAAAEAAAALVGQIATEGDAGVAAVRKNLLEGGHHHHATLESRGIYDEGYVVVTKQAKAVLLEAAKALGQIARAPMEEALDREWARVEGAWSGLAAP